MFTLANLVTWVAVGLIGGTLAGRVVTWQKAGFGLFSNLVLGCAGAIVGGALFEMLNLLPSLDKVSISAAISSPPFSARSWCWACAGPGIAGRRKPAAASADARPRPPGVLVPLDRFCGLSFLFYRMLVFA